MNTAESESAVVAEHVEPKASEAVIETPRDFETEARKDGWVPESEWKGEKRPAVFLDAETFVKKGEEFATFSRKENKQLRKELDELKKSVDSRVTKLVNVGRANFEREQANYEKEIARLKNEQVKAVEAGDVPAFKRLDKEISETLAPEEVDEPATEGAATVDGNAIVAKFQEKNPWYKTDKLLTAYAERLSDKIAKDSDDKLPLADNLELVERKMRLEYPEQYATKKATNGHANVDGGSDFSTVSRSDPLLKLPNEARTQCLADMAKYPDIYKTKAAWIAVYEKK